MSKNRSEGMRSGTLLFSLAMATCFAVYSEEPPTIPVGLDVYRQWERWPVQRVGARAYMRSTYDRRGGNEGADASHFLYQLADDYNVALDVEGPGVFYFARYNHWHGSPWHYVIDGTDHIVQESSSAKASPAPNAVFMPQELFPSPLAFTWSTTRGADLNWVPIPFAKSFRMAYSRTHYGTGYYIYHQYVRGAHLFGEPIAPWDGKTPPDKDVLELIARSGSDLVPRAGSPDALRLGLVEQSGAVALPAKSAVTLAELASAAAPTQIRAVEFDIPHDKALEFGRASLRITWDGRAQASIDAPVALFYGAGVLYNRDNREYLVKAFPVYVRYEKERVKLACFFPMPFFRSAKIELVGAGTAINDIHWSVRTQPSGEPARHLTYFHATYRDFATPEPGKDLVLLDTRETEGSVVWSGSFVGTSFIFSDRAVLNTLEGDPRFFFNDSQTPQAQGTGTEEWGGGGDYWGGQTMTLPFAGHPCGARNAKDAKCDEDKIESAYRFLLADLMPFGRNARIQLEHGGVNESTEHYQTVTYWYGSLAATLVPTDSLQLGDAASETAHAYASPQASEPYEIVSRYEWGPDTTHGSPKASENDRPRAEPEDSAEFEFEAEAKTTYTILGRGKNIDGKNSSDAFWMQFDDDIGSTRLAATCSHLKGMGNWIDRFPKGVFAWSSALPQDPPQTIVFESGGKHRLRIQPRQPGHVLEEIWLSASQKTLPDPAKAVPQQSSSEIVLDTKDALRLKGQIKLVDDAAVGKVLEIKGRATDIGGGGGGTIVVYPAHTDHGRKTTGISEFTLKLDPKNVGAMLRRKLDYAFPNQRAEVFIADASHEGAPIVETDWKPAGGWYLAGSNTCVYSNPQGELAAAQHMVQTSNRRFRDDEFLMPRDLTEGRAAIRVRIKFTPVNTPLFPGHPLPELAWSEIRYDLYCFVSP